jgi:hypothetical protein
MADNMNTSRSVVASLLVVCALAVAPSPAQAQDDTGNEYRLTLFPSVRLSDQVTGFAYLGYVTNPDKDYRTYYLGWPCAAYSPSQWLQIWGGLVGLYTANQQSSDKLELRPFAGVKVFVPNKAKWNIYNFTRYEYRATEDRATHDWTGVHRLRSRFGIEFPMASGDRAWQPKTFYGLADIEPYYRFDREQVDPFRIRAGIGYVAYHAQYTHPTGTSGLSYTDNIFRLNVKIGLSKGLIGRLHNPDIDE